MKLVPLTSVPNPDWLRLRKALWPEGSDAEHEREMAQFVADPKKYGQFMACSDGGTPTGFVEVPVRSDYVNGTDTSPVAFLEGLYVVPESRRQGVARRMLANVRTWALARGCTELASDTQLENTLSQAVHACLGFTESERVVYFNMRLGPENAAQHVGQPEPPRHAALAAMRSLSMLRLAARAPCRSGPVTSTLGL